MCDNDLPYTTLDEISKNTSCPNVTPKKIIFNDPATIVIWDDGTKKL